MAWMSNDISYKITNFIAYSCPNLSETLDRDGGDITV